MFAVIKIYVLSIAFMSLISCDCYQNVSGTVIDERTGKPLNGVTVYNNQKTWSKTMTDTTGYFKVTNVSGGIRCPPMSILVEKSGYQKLEASIASGQYSQIK